MLTALVLGRFGEFVLESMLARQYCVSCRSVVGLLKVAEAQEGRT